MTGTAGQGIHLRVVGEDNVRAACALELEAGQERFVAPVAISLAEAYVQPEAAWPRLVYDGDTVVGFVMAHFDESNGERYLWRLNIAAGSQRKRYGTSAVTEVARESTRRGGTTAPYQLRPRRGQPAALLRTDRLHTDGQSGRG